MTRLSWRSPSWCSSAPKDGEGAGYEGWFLPQLLFFLSVIRLSPDELENSHTMKSQSTQYAGRRSRRGRRRRSGRTGAVAVPTKAVQKPSFWQKVVAFFTRPKPAPSTKVIEKQGQNGVPKEKISRKPELVEVTSPKLYVGNLSFDATESDLFELFAGVGQVRNAEVVCHKYTQRSKGFAFVQMTTIEEARRAVQELHDKEFLGRKLVVSGAKTPDMERAA
jgi:RNA recognition motif